jgi:hypothetical protein
MSFTYRGQPEKYPLDQVRILIGDVDPCDPLLQDAEIQLFLDDHNQAPVNASIRCCEVIIARLSRRPDEQVGLVKIFYSQQAKGYRALLTDLRNRLAQEDANPYAGGLSKADKEVVRANPDRVKPDFTRHMMQNHEIGPTVSNPFDNFGPEDEPTEGG